MLLNKKNDWIGEKQINLVGQFSECFYFFIFSDLRKRLHAISLLTFNLSQKRPGCMSCHCDCDCDCVWYKLHFFFFFEIVNCDTFLARRRPKSCCMFLWWKCNFNIQAQKNRQTDRKTERLTVEGHGYNRWSTKVCTITTVYVPTYSGTNCHWIEI